MRAINWRRAAGEVVLIVTGILIAFALNAWWAGRQETQQEAAYLRQLLTDVQDYEQHIQASIAHDRRMQRHAMLLLDSIHSNEPLPAFDSLATWLIHALDFSDIRPINVTFEALIQTGDVSLIQNDSLRNRIIATVGYIDYTLGKLRQTEEELLTAFRELQQHIDYHELVPFWPGMALRPPAYHRHPIDFEALRDDKVFNGAMFTGYSFASIRLLYLNRMLDEMQAIRRLLEQEFEAGLNT